jgi:hypothetical protein
MRFINIGMVDTQPYHTIPAEILGGPFIHKILREVDIKPEEFVKLLESL